METTISLFAFIITEDNVREARDRYQHYVLPAYPGQKVVFESGKVIVSRSEHTVWGEYERLTTECWMSTLEEFHASFVILEDARPLTPLLAVDYRRTTGKARS